MRKFMLLNTNIGEGIASHLSQFHSPVYGIAALLIILFHAMGPVKEHWLSFFKYGYIGVDMYLMIGAFCICYSFKRHSLKQFYINRFLRIYPLWFFVCNLRTIYLLLSGGDVEWYSIPIIGILVYVGQTLIGMFLLNQVNIFFNNRIFNKYIKH